MHTYFRKIWKYKDSQGRKTSPIIVSLKFFLCSNLVSILLYLIHKVTTGIIPFMPSPDYAYPPKVLPGFLLRQIFPSHHMCSHLSTQIIMSFRSFYNSLHHIYIEGEWTAGLKEGEHSFLFIYQTVFSSPFSSPRALCTINIMHWKLPTKRLENKNYSGKPLSCLVYRPQVCRQHSRDNVHQSKES